MNRREYFGALAAGLAACTGGEPSGSEAPSTAIDVTGGAAAAAQPAPGVRVLTDFRSSAAAPGTARENWGPALEAAWNSAAEEGTDVFVPAGTYRIRMREGRSGYGPAVDLAQSGKYRPVRILGPSRGAELRLEHWPGDAPRDLEVIRVRTGVRRADGGLDVATGAQIAGLVLTNASGPRFPGWEQPFDHTGIGIRLVGLYGAAVSNCLFRGFSSGLVLGNDQPGEGTSYLTSVFRNRFQYCNQAVRNPPTANGSSIRENLALWIHRPSVGPRAAFETGYATTSVFFAENSVEQVAGWVYGIGATTNARIAGGRLESVHGAVRVQGTGAFPARGTQIEGLSVDCDALRYPALWMERSAGALLSGITFYQNATGHPHLMLDAGTENTTVLAVGTFASERFRMVDRSRGLTWVGARP